MQAGTAARFGAAVCLAFVLCTALAPGALAQDEEELLRDSTMAGEPRTPTGDIIGPIFEKIVWASIAVFLLVAVLLTYIIIRFRHRKGRKVDVPQIHGNSKLEIAWTIGPALVMFWLLVISYNGLLAIDIPEEEPEVFIEVTAAQFVWSFTYPDGQDVTGRALRVQEDTWVQFNVTSTDVIHAFSVPGLDVMIDANPGYINRVQMFAREPGTYLVQCRQFCGTGHGDMLAAVEVFEAGSQPLPYGEPPRDPEPPEEEVDPEPTNISADVVLEVEAYEFGFDPSPLRGVSPGDLVQIVLDNVGNAPHNLYMGTYDPATDAGEVTCRDPDDEETCAKTEFTVAPGGRDTFVFEMPDEMIAFDIWCDVPGHASAGMLTYLSVGDAVPDREEFSPRLPGPGFALAILGVLGVALVARRRA